MDFQRLVQKGRFLEACQSISVLAEDGQDCGPQYQVVAKSMWPIVQEALGSISYNQELELKLQAVVATVQWAQDNPQDGGVAAWGRHLEKLLMRDAEARVPTMKPWGQLGPYLEELDKAVGQALGSQRAGRLGAPLWAMYRTCFQVVLLSRLSQLVSSHSHDRESCCELYAWGERTLCGQLGETSEAGPSSLKPTASNLLDPESFTNWMFGMQETLVRLFQEELEERLRKLLLCDQKKWAASLQPMFHNIRQLLEECINAVRHNGPPITRQVQDMVLGTFSKFLESYKDEAARFIQQNAGDQTFPELHVMGNCCILRNTWESLTQAHVSPSDLDPTVQGDIRFIEDRGRDHLLPRVRALCQVGEAPLHWDARASMPDHLCLPPELWLPSRLGLAQSSGVPVDAQGLTLEMKPREGKVAPRMWKPQSLLRGYFGKSDKDLVQALQSLWQGLSRCTVMHHTPTYESLVRSLHMVVFGEYVQALAAHVRTLGPGTSGHLSAQVDMDIWKLNNVFRVHRGPDLDNLRQPIFQLSESEGRETMDQWLASFSDRFPGYLSWQDSSVAVEEETEVRGCCSCCYRFPQLLLRACWHPRCPCGAGGER
ncbi:uncharacterized protein LOC131421194 [Diceros bicornis minor]|uniref:uncharacterized protein LOC131421194 n=1 Tax=Diceros bicornis minor TaxID=77932 RepID=UPI0026EC7648|nr:uncharacterized protein LOC131421194 [Diceros bicornis minor]